MQKRAGNLARSGQITTAHGVINTPAYIAPATKATLKALSNEDALEASSQVMMMNTYHLMLEPGADVVEKAGGLHRFSGWQGPIMTDSGGFQAFSLGEAMGTGISKFTSWAKPSDAGSPVSTSVGIREDDYRPSQNPKKAVFDDDGVNFFSHIDGSKKRITPESSIQTQTRLGSDIMFVFDECVSPNAPREAHISAIERTRLWAERCLVEHLEPKVPSGTLGSGALFGIVQGGRYEDLRRQSAKQISSMGLARPDGSRGGFDGFGIGGSFVKEDMGTAVRFVCEELPEDKPRHLLGVGEPPDIFEMVENGIDTFDCVASTRKARTGALYTKTGAINVTNAKYREHFAPIESDCTCTTCQPRDGRAPYTCAYLHHLFRAHELVAFKLASVHNLHFITNLTAQIRTAILDGSFKEYKVAFLTRYTNSVI